LTSKMRDPPPPLNGHARAVARQHKAAAIVIVFVVGAARLVPRADAGIGELKLPTKCFDPHGRSRIAAQLEPAHLRRGDPQSGAGLDLQVGRQQPLARRQLAQHVHSADHSAHAG
jgi:hypothetical protein